MVEDRNMQEIFRWFLINFNLWRWSCACVGIDNWVNIHTLCGKNAEIFNARPCDKYSNHWASKRLNKHDGCKKKSHFPIVCRFSLSFVHRNLISVFCTLTSRKGRQELARHVAELASWLWRRGTAGVRRRRKRQGEKWRCIQEVDT